MCTAVTYKTKDHYFGRNLDLEYSYQERITITPRNYVFHFRKMGEMKCHFAMIGMAYIVEGYPLYYDAVNEKGLSIAGLNFPQNADYKPYCEGKENVTPYELIPWILGQCATVSEAENLLERINLLNENFSKDIPLTPLHWMISDRKASVTVESVRDGLNIYDNPVGVLTNNPPFDFHMYHLAHYMQLSKEEPENRFSETFMLKPYSRGMGALGLPGDLSSASRFVRAVFTKMNSISGDTESESISQFFHILGAVAQQRGCVRLPEGQYEMTLYTSCCNIDKGIYYYTTYENSRITGVDMYRENLDEDKVITYPLIKGQQVLMQNEAFLQ